MGSPRGRDGNGTKHPAGRGVREGELWTKGRGEGDCCGGGMNWVPLTAGGATSTLRRGCSDGWRSGSRVF